MTRWGPIEALDAEMNDRLAQMQEVVQALREENERLREESAKVREVNAEQAKHIGILTAQRDAARENEEKWRARVLDLEARLMAEITRLPYGWWTT